jgi:hypothetical protein
MADPRPLSATVQDSRALGVALCIRIGAGPDANECALDSATSMSPNWPARTSTFICSPRPERTSLAMNPDCELARLADELSDIAGSWRINSARADVA